ncbi:MAG: hypothetical protein U5K31_13560 [Balneolaceae bacterium]|nr:hypothetical protein [Balneolaceae bacterium]
MRYAMRKITQTITKGVLSLLIVMVMVSTLSFIIQSCAVNVENAETTKNRARSNFISLAKATSFKLQRIDEKSVSLEMASDIPDASKRKLEREAKKSLSPLLESGREVLDAYGFTDEVFLETGMSKDDPQALYVVFAILKNEEIQQSEISFLNIFLNSCTEVAYASKFWDCAWKAAGFEFGMEYFRLKEMNTIEGKKRLIKMFTKIGARYLGYVGVAIATYTFIDCMWLSE